MSCQSRLTILVALLAALLAAEDRAQAKDTIVNAPRQLIWIDGEPVQFGASVRICKEGVAEGGAQFAFLDGTSLDLQAVHGVDSDAYGFGVIVFVVDDVDYDVAENGFVVARLRPVPDDPVCQLWDFTGSSAQGAEPFDAVTTITYAPASACRPADFGQEFIDVGVKAKPQLVQPEQLRQQLFMMGKLKVSGNQSADGQIRLQFENGDELDYDVHFGAVFFRPLENRTVVRAVGIERQRGFGFVVQVEVSTTEIEDCLLWDLVNGSTGEVRYTFEAESQLDLIQR